MKQASRFIPIGFFAFIAILMLAPSSAQAFDAGRIIDNGVFTNTSTMSISDIQGFLNSKVSSCETFHAPGTGSQGEQPPWRCLRDYAENPTTKENNLDGRVVPAGGKSAAQIIWEVSQAHGVNPQVILVTLQKENGLINDSWPYDWQYRTAMGMGCPDGAPCDDQYFGFYNQVNQGVRHLKCYYNASEGTPCSGFFTPYTKGSGRFVKYHPNGACGGTNVNILNGATAALYSYTPYQPNQASLDAGFGTGDGCSSYGNRNFFNYFNLWFGSTYTPAYAVGYAGQSAYPTVYAGESITVNITYKNIGALNWYDDVSAAGAGASPVHLSTSHPLNRFSLVGTLWGGDQNRPSGTFSKVLDASGTPYTTNPHVVKPGEHGRFEFQIFGPTNIAPGVYREYFQPIVEGGDTMNDAGTFMDVTILPTYSSAFYRQGLYATLAPNATQNTFIDYKNTGNQSWYDDDSISGAPTGTKPVHLATTRPLNRFSLVGTLWGGQQNRPALRFGNVYESNGTTLAANQHIVQPGQIGRFPIKFYGPANLPPGTYREYFQPVVEGGDTMNDPGTFLDATLVPATYGSQYAGQSTYPIVVRGSTVDSYLQYKNIGNQAWYDDAGLGSAPSGTKPVHLSTTRSLNRFSLVGTAWGGDQNRPTTSPPSSARNFQAVYESDGVTLAANQHSVQPGQIGRFGIKFFGPTNLSPGKYREFFQPIIEGGTTMNDPGTFLDVTLQ